MLGPLRNRTYRHLLAAQIVALTGTGLATVALGLLAFGLAGKDAGAVLGTALAIKMVAYVGVAPVAQAFAVRLPRRGFLVAMDLVRAAVVLLLPFVDAVWQIYLLIFLLQSASAAFTPAFQATIPDVLPDERDYTRALSLSRLAYDTESLVSPMLAAALLAVIDFHWLFAATALGFAVSAALVLSTVLPAATPAPLAGGIYDRITRGAQVYLATPRLRGLLALNLAAAAGGGDGDRQHGGLCAGRHGPARNGRGHGVRRLRRRLDGGGTSAAAGPGPPGRPAGDGRRRGGPGRSARRRRHRLAGRTGVLARPAL